MREPSGRIPLWQENVDLADAGIMARFNEGWYIPKGDYVFFLQEVRR